MSDTDQDKPDTFFSKHKKTLLPVGLVLGVAGIGLFAAISSGPVTSTKPSSGAAPTAGRAGLGGVNPTAEFNKTFADQLRVELINKLETERKAQNQVLENDRAQQSNQLSAALATQKQEILDAIAASKKQEPEPEQAIKKQIRPPTASTKAPADAVPQSAGTSPQSSISEKVNPLVAIVAPTGFVRATMINGVVAQPDLARTFLGRLEGDYVAANGYRISLDGCMVTIEGIADVSAGRIDGKPAVLTCNFDNGFSKSWDVAGYIVDDDGIRGIRGVTVNNLEKKLIAGSLAGGVSGLGDAIRQKQTTQTASGTGGVASNITGSVGAAVAGSALAGAGANAAGALAEYYAQYKTTVQTGAGTKFSITLLSELTVPREGSYITPLTTRK